MAAASSGLLSSSLAPGEAEVTAVTGWGGGDLLRDGLLSTLVGYGRAVCEEGRWALSTRAANLPPTPATQVVWREHGAGAVGPRPHQDVSVPSFTGFFSGGPVQETGLKLHLFVSRVLERTMNKPASWNDL